MLLFSHLAYVSGDGLNILFTVYAGNGRQRPVVKRDQRQRRERADDEKDDVVERR